MPVGRQWDRALLAGELAVTKPTQPHLRTLAGLLIGGPFIAAVAFLLQGVGSAEAVDLLNQTGDVPVASMSFVGSTSRTYGCDVVAGRSRPSWF